MLTRLADEACILMGDFNITPTTPLLAPIRRRMTDTAALFDTPKLSFPSDAPTDKIDSIFASADLQVTAADIPAVVASDHRPHLCDVVL